jgi:hypothetical protein
METSKILNVRTVVLCMDRGFMHICRSCTLVSKSFFFVIVETVAMYQVLGCCAGIVSHGWDMNQYCQHEGWIEGQ